MDQALMPEIKRTFQAGKMNRSLDDRLVKPGEYREALNVNIGRSDGSDVGAVENILGNVGVTNYENFVDGTVIGSYRDNGNERIYFFVTNNDDDAEQNTGDHRVLEFDQRTNKINVLVSGSFLDFHVNFTITGINLVDSLLFWTDDRNEPRKINVTRARNDANYYNTDDKTAVAKFAPFTPPLVTEISNSLGAGEGDSNFLEDKIVRFAYRYKFNDGELSTISPFTPVCFISETGDNGTLDSYANGEITSFINQAKRVFLTVDIPVNYGITGVELLYTESTSSNIYILEELTTNTDTTDEDTETIPLNFIYRSQDPFRTLPGNQLTRVYDAVPRRAKSQEFAGGRLIYGNYVENYNLPTLSFSVVAVNKSDAGVYGRFSVKSRRTYQVGVVLADRFGRQTPVILSSTGDDTVFVDALDGNDAMQQLEISFDSSFPDWAHSYRVVVKQRQQEYYNWFWTQSGDNFSITGNNINKIPRDTTAETITIGNTAIASSNVKVFPKLDLTNGNTNATSITSPRQIDSIRFTDGSINAVVDLGSGLGSAGVAETVPVESEIDIFFETSTGGLIPEDQVIQNLPIEFFNCYVWNFGTNSHIELNRIRAGFNEAFFSIGVKAYVVQENFAEQRRFNTLIHSSGLFNSRVGINYVNQFNETEGGLTISLDPSDGSIQKLYAEDTQVLIFQEDKVSRSPIDKDFIFSAEGGSVPVTSSTQYLGTVAAYAGEYGISRDPESFAVYGTRKYFADKNRGVVLRLSNDGLTEISEYGMTDFFRDALRGSNRIIGSFDEYHDNYNITIEGTTSYSGYKDTNVATGNDGYFTVSFEEEVGGWPSFKSFKQEGGLTLNNRYYTLNGGRVWEHNTGDVYNNFYGVQHGSYMECIMNDSPSDVKEFKTVNYEGNAGWVCDTFDTDFESLRLEPGARDLETVWDINLNLEGAVGGAEVFGIQSQSVRDEETYKWVIQLTPSSTKFSFINTSDATATFDGEELTPILNDVNSNIYFVTPEFTALDHTTHVLSVMGEAIEDISGAILIVSLDSSLSTDDFTFEIQEGALDAFPSDFRGGPTSYAFLSSSETRTIDAKINITDANAQLFELVASDLEYVFTDSLTDLITDDPVEYDVDNVDFPNSIEIRQNITIPNIATRGGVTLTQRAGGSILRLRPRITFQIFSMLDGGGDISTDYKAYHFVDGILIELSLGEDFEVPGVYTSGQMVEIDRIFFVPNYTEGETDDDPDTGFIFPVGTLSSLSSQLDSFIERRITLQELVDEPELTTVQDFPNDFLLGAIEFTPTSRALTLGTNKTTGDVLGSQIIVQGTLRAVGAYDLKGTDGKDDEIVFADGFTYDLDDTDDPTFVVSNSVYNIDYEITESSFGFFDEDNNPVNNLEPDITYTLGTSSDSLTSGDYTITFTAIPDAVNFLGDTFVPRVLTMTIE